MLTLPELEDSPLALLLVSDDDEVAVVNGVVRIRNGHLVFEHGGDPSHFPLPEDTLERIERINRDDKALVEIFGDAAFMLAITVGNLPNDASSDDAVSIGMRWPKE